MIVSENWIRTRHFVYSKRGFTPGANVLVESADNHAYTQNWWTYAQSQKNMHLLLKTELGFSKF